ncbi:L-histidine N(alpha)-methyltransferase [Nocardia sp. NPDC048505]|uniref:L-histidine N(alpha)-methyltransferase n=1 Tax=Nocardia sp. NPDC048505 TaxID=3155756 RepID=UPI0033F1CB1C
MLVIDRYLTDGDYSGALRAEFASWLTGAPKALPCRLLHAGRAVRPVRGEGEILAAHARAIAGASGACTLLELGAGRPEHASALIEGLAPTLLSYVLVAANAQTVQAGASAIAHRHPRLAVRAVVADFTRQLHRLPARGGRLITLLGGYFAALPPAERAAFLTQVRTTMEWDDCLLLGLDLVGEPRRPVAAARAESEVTAEFNRNILQVANRELGTDFRPGRFDHVVDRDPRRARIELRLRARERQRVRVPGLGTAVELAAGEQIRTAVLSTFDLARIEAELVAAGFALDRIWPGESGEYAVVLARPADQE